MKKTVFLLMLISGLLKLGAQDTTAVEKPWSKGGQFVFTVSQSTFSDWAAGGENSYSGHTRLGLFANYKKNNISWENTLDMAYGVSQQQSIGEVRKSDDLIELDSKFGLKATDKLFYSALLGAKSQFYEGRKYSDATTYKTVSDFMAPLLVNIALGIDYKPNKYASLFGSPINSKITYVNDTAFSIINSMEEGEKLRYELGLITKFRYQKDVMENMNVMTKLDLFADYLEFEKLEDVDVSWEVLVTLKVLKAISVNFNTHLIWDNDVKTVNANGIAEEAKIQVKEIFGAGVSFMF